METAVIVQIISTIGSVIVAVVGVGLPIFFKTRKEREAQQQALVAQITATVDALRSDMEGNTRLTVSNARAQLESIYNKYHDKQSMPLSSWKAVCELHAAYKGVVVDGHVPNHWADELYHEMEGWEKK